MRQEGAALRDFDPAYVRFGSFSTYRSARAASRMSAMAPRATRLMRHNGPPLRAITGLEQMRQIEPLFDHLVG
jgi:hypothetical protein